jgi:hypothetical protein
MIPADFAPIPTPSASPPVLLWGTDSLRADSQAAIPWLWHGYLAPGALTLLTSQWKSGKTTLVSVLLAKLRAGGALAGLPLAAARPVVVSEEPRELWQLRSRRLDFGEQLGWFCRPFRARPEPVEWHALLEQIAGLYAERGVALAVIDPLAAFLPGKSENDAVSMLEALMPLRRLTSLGMAVLVLHHPRKREAAPGQAPRGSGALLGHADILLEMRRCPKATDDDRRRRLYGFSRYEETPRELMIELTADGTDYVSLGTFQEGEFAAGWKVLKQLLETAPRKLTRSEIIRRWPPAVAADPASVHRWLNHAVTCGLVCRDGRGRRNHPFRYWLPGQEHRWRQDPLAAFHMPELFQRDPATPPQAFREP